MNWPVVSTAVAGLLIAGFLIGNGVYDTRYRLHGRTFAVPDGRRGKVVSVACPFDLRVTVNVPANDVQRAWVREHQPWNDPDGTRDWVTCWRWQLLP